MDSFKYRLNHMTKRTLIYLFTFVFTALGKGSFAQATPNPCDFPNIECGAVDRNGVIYPFGSDTINYASVGRSMPFWFAVGDTVTGIVDTTTNCDFTLVKIFGPGEIYGWGIHTDPKKITYYDSVYFNKPGLYAYHINENNSILYDTVYFNVPPEVNFCSEVPGGGCINGGGNQVYSPQHGVIVPVDAVVPIKVGVIDSISGMLDSSYSGTIYVDKVNGPGSIYGSLSMTGDRWFNFTNIRFSEEGWYTLKFFDLDTLNIKPEYVDVEVVATSNSNSIAVNDLRVFPNPFKDVITIQSKTILNETVVRINNFQGQTILNKQLNTRRNTFNLNTELLVEGIYFIRILEKGNVIEVGKIVKMK